MAIINGTPGNDSGINALQGTNDNDTIKGFEGEDELYGNSGDDAEFGGDDDDYLQGGIGDDTLNGGAGQDWLDGGGGNDTLYGTAGEDHLIGNFGDDVYFINSVGDTTLEYQAADGRDRLYSTIGWTLSDYIDRLILLTNDNLDGTGNGQANRIDGNAGDNVLSGLAGDDNLLGNAGDDTLVGGLGKDYQRGGAGADTFEYNAVGESVVVSGRDQILDFQTGVDEIDLVSIDANTILGGDQAFSFIGNSVFSGAAAGELRISANNVLQGDVNGDGVADFQIQLQASATVVQTDFVL